MRDKDYFAFHCQQPVLQLKQKNWHQRINNFRDEKEKNVHFDLEFNVFKIGYVCALRYTWIALTLKFLYYLISLKAVFKGPTSCHKLQRYGKSENLSKLIIRVLITIRLRLLIIVH